MRFMVFTLPVCLSWGLVVFVVGGWFGRGVVVVCVVWVWVSCVVVGSGAHVQWLMLLFATGCSAAW